MEKCDRAQKFLLRMTYSTSNDGPRCASFVSEKQQRQENGGVAGQSGSFMTNGACREKHKLTHS